jgi:hypothetical protein
MKTKLAMLAVLGATAIVTSGASQASSVTVSDTYVGGSLSSGVDVLGGPKYEVSGLTATRTGNNLSVVINTNYADNIGADGTQIGSLFIGNAANLNLSGTGPAYTADTFSADTGRYGYVFDYDVANSTVTGGSSGTGTLYSLVGDGSDVKLSFGTVKRTNQGVDRSGGTATSTIGTWSVGAGTVTYNIADFFAISGMPTSLTLAWAMSCANDIILTTLNLPGDEVPTVPLPAGVLLLGTALSGLGFMGRRKKAN